MLIDGEKWACEACIRGHRVSNCNHADRPLQHINKKGRPVSQCHHCRSMRKSRTSHVKCDCGEKTHKCAHLKTPVDGHRDSCCCNHGGRCTCSHKKEHPQLDTVLESESDKEAQASKSASSKTSGRRRRANTANSEGKLTFDDKGHHKPTYKHIKASQKNSPYQLGRVNSMPGTGTKSNRSADSLVDAESRGGKRDSTASREKRKVRSETGSPVLPVGSFGQPSSQLSPLDLSDIKYPPYLNSYDLFGSLSDNDQGLFSAGLGPASVDWSHYDLDCSSTSDNFAPSNYSQPQSYGGFDFTGSEQAPTMTTANSGEVSEVEDFLGPCLDDFDGSITFGGSGAALGSYQGATSLGAFDYDLGFLKAGTKFLPTPPSVASDEASMPSVSGAGTNTFSYVDDDPALWMDDYSGPPYFADSPNPSTLSY